VNSYYRFVRYDSRTTKYAYIKSTWLGLKVSSVIIWCCFSQLFLPSTGAVWPPWHMNILTARESTLQNILCGHPCNVFHINRLLLLSYRNISRQTLSTAITLASLNKIIQHCSVFTTNSTLVYFRSTQSTNISVTVNVVLKQTWSQGHKLQGQGQGQDHGHGLQCQGQLNSTQLTLTHLVWPHQQDTPAREA